MTLYEIIHTLKAIALNQPNVRTATDGSIYEIMDAKNSVEYDVFHITQTTHTEDEVTDIYGLTLFYVSRLEDSLEDNRLQIQSIGKEILGNVVRTFCENFAIDFPTITYIPFTQKFVDLTAGQYCNIRIEIPKELVCADDYISEVVPGKNIKLQDLGITITQNGLTVVTPDAEYDGIGEIRIVTDVPQSSAVLQYKEVEYEENGEYTVRPDVGYDGLSEVAISISVPSSGGGYDEGYADGVADQKAKLSTLSVSANGQYDRADGYSAITVDVPQTGQTINNQSKTYTFTKNNTQIVQSVGGDYYLYGGEIIQPDSGYTGLDKATISLQANITDLYNSGYTDGFAAGASACSGYFISALTLVVDSAITDYGTATTTYSPESAITDIYYTSSDPSIATIDSGTGEITIIRNGTVTICAQDSITHLQDCKQVNVTLSPEPEYLTFEILTAGTIQCNNIDDARGFYYRINNGDWVSAPSSSLTLNVSENDIVNVRGNYGITKINFQQSTAYYKVYGKLRSVGNWHFSYAFDGTNVVDASDLSFAGLSSGIKFSGMFKDCTSLVYPPSTLPLVSIDEQYAAMFQNCTSLTAVPYDYLPSTSMQQACYSRMFQGCTSLVQAPKLPAIHLQRSCYSYMFAGCTSLRTAPELPARGSSSYCYIYMFSGCSQLSYVKALLTSTASGEVTNNWLAGVSATGTFVKNPNMAYPWPTGASGIPSGWTIIDNS